MGYIKNEDENKRSYYIILFCSVLIISIITTILIYYFVRYKKKLYFDAAGRKLIETSGDYQNFVTKLREIIENDDIILLEQVVVKNSVGIITLINECDQNSLHISAIFGASECLRYLLKFDFLNPNAQDKFDKIPLEYLIMNHSEEIEDNKIMFVHLLLKTDNKLLNLKNLPNKFAIWQINIYNSFFRKTPVKLII